MDLYKERLLRENLVLCCHDVLKKATIKTTCKFIDSVNRGKLVHPSSSLNSVVKITNSCIEEVENQ